MSGIPIQRVSHMWVVPSGILSAVTVYRDFQSVQHRVATEVFSNHWYASSGCQFDMETSEMKASARRVVQGFGVTISADVSDLGSADCPAPTPDLAVIHGPEAVIAGSVSRDGGGNDSADCRDLLSAGRDIRVHAAGIDGISADIRDVDGAARDQDRGNVDTVFREPIQIESRRDGRGLVRVIPVAGARGARAAASRE